MNILVLCAHGKNRSRYLAEYLSSKGYTTDYAGVESSDARTVQKKIDEADILITVHPLVKEGLFEYFYVGEHKRLIELNIEDRPEQVLSEHQSLDGEAWTQFQHSSVYPRLKEQIDAYLPFE